MTQPRKRFGAGGKGIRTPGLLIANETLYQLSYTPGRGAKISRRSDLSATERSPSHFAEEVEKVNPDLVARDAKGKVYTVRYEAVNAMLLNEFLKEHRTVEELKKEMAALTATVKEQAAQIQKVSAQLEVNKTAPQTVLNNQ